MRTERVGSSMILLQIARESTGCVSYILGSLADKSCIIVDPLLDYELYRAALQESGFTVVGIIDTHTHADHFSGLRYLLISFRLRFSPFTIHHLLGSNVRNCRTTKSWMSDCLPILMGRLVSESFSHLDTLLTTCVCLSVLTTPESKCFFW